jgi:two-component system, OmpR family, response regulator MprA
VKILVVDDERAVRESLRRALELEGYEIDLAGDGEEALATLGREQSQPDAVILDVLMPGVDGLEVCRRVRATGNHVPVLMLTARDEVENRVAGLDAGADDYVTKPFALEELLARVRALGRRAGEEHHDLLSVGDLTLDIARHEARRGEREIELTAKEFDLLAYLMRNTGRVLSKDQITEHVWGYDSQATSNVVEIYIHYLRDKVDRGFPRPLIRTIRGVGYTIKN